MTSRNTTVLVGVASLFAGLAILVANAQQVSGPVRIVQLTGLVGIHAHGPHEPAAPRQVSGAGKQRSLQEKTQ
jgi:hypothetical protein